MACKKQIWWVLSLFLCLSIWRGPLPAWGKTASAPMRSVIVFDTSGSMHENDPHRLSLVAAQLFLELAQPQDALGLAAFSDNSASLVPLLPLASPATKQMFQARLRALRFTGQTTDLAAALEVGLSSFPPDTGGSSRDLVLLLTDGKLDLGQRRRAEEPAVLARIRQTLLPQYRQRGIALYTIAFTEQADQALLQEMAQLTGGEFRLIPEATMLHRAFVQLFILAHQAEALPLKQGELLLDASIQDTSLVISKRHPQERVTLVTPQGLPLHASSTHPGVTWSTTSSYDLVHLMEPESGTWRIEGPAGVEKSIAIIGASTLGLQVEISPAYREPGEPIIISAFLEEQGQRARDTQQVQGLTLRAEVTTPQGEAIVLPLEPQDAGRFAVTLTALHQPGRYDLVVTADAPAVRRQRTLSFAIHPPCFQPSVSTEAPVMVYVTLADTCPHFLELALEAGYAMDDGPTTWAPLVSPRSRLFQVTIPLPPPGQGGRVVMRLRGRLKGGEPFVLMKGPWLLSATPLPVTPPPATPLPPPGANRLLLFNGMLVLVGCGGLGLLLWRAQRVQRRLRAELTQLQCARQEHAEATPSLLTLSPSASASEKWLRDVSTSVQYSSDNLRFLQDTFGDLMTLLKEYSTLLQATRAGAVTEEIIHRVEATTEEIDVTYLIEESPKAIQQALEGAENIAKIMQHLRGSPAPGREKDHHQSSQDHQRMAVQG